MIVLDANILIRAVLGRAGVAVWNTNRVEIFFRQQLKAIEPQQE